MTKNFFWKYFYSNLFITTSNHYSEEYTNKIKWVVVKDVMLMMTHFFDYMKILKNFHRLQKFLKKCQSHQKIFLMNLLGWIISYNIVGGRRYWPSPVPIIRMFAGMGWFGNFDVSGSGSRRRRSMRVYPGIIISRNISWIPRIHAWTRWRSRMAPLSWTTSWRAFIEL